MLVLNVYYFMISTLLVSIKLFIAWYVALRANPGYVERDQISEAAQAEEGGDSERRGR